MNRPRGPEGFWQALRAECRRSGPYLVLLFLALALLIWAVLELSKP